MKARLYFNDGSISILPVTESALITQMSRPQHKRFYTCGIQFDEVLKAEVVEE